MSANSVVPFPFVICPCGDTLKDDERCPKCGTWFRLNDAK